MIQLAEMIVTRDMFDAMLELIGRLHLVYNMTHAVPALWLGDLHGHR